ncbi:hypothetical protein HSBAA_06650 [Vreelandella sulfidaeris]|uniref:Solute-binding protein family 5 domain-containing protein n=1 Tax=Vreelandella sulfidaeris TaxID=115553 RepID=A0A455U3L3_9GAMM|nr:hypothetical protein HSBAA_06650 [Halomonas sulfidaeris]
MTKTRTLMGPVALALAFSVATPLQADTLRLAIMGEPASLDPHKISGTWENDVVGDLLKDWSLKPLMVAAFPALQSRGKSPMTARFTPSN